MGLIHPATMGVTKDSEELYVMPFQFPEEKDCLPGDGPLISLAGLFPPIYLVTLAGGGASCCYCFFVFLGLHLRHMEVPSLGVESEL